MKTNFIITLAFLIFSVNAFSLIDFKPIGYEQALKQAAQSNKLVYVYFTDTNFSDINFEFKSIQAVEEVGKFYNTNFICITVNAQSSDAALLRTKFGETYLPAHLYINNSGILQHKIIGPLDAATLIKSGEIAVSDHNLAALNFEWGKGSLRENNSELISYINVLIQSGSNYSEPANFFLENFSENDYSSIEATNLALTLCDDVYSRTFKIICSQYFRMNFGENEQTRFKINEKICYQIQKAAMQNKQISAQDTLQNLCNYLEWGNSEQLILMTEFSTVKLLRPQENVYLDILVQFLANNINYLSFPKIEDYLIQIIQSQRYIAWQQQTNNWAHEVWDRTQNPEALLLLAYANYRAGRTTEASDFINTAKQMAHDQGVSINGSIKFYKALMPGLL